MIAEALQQHCNIDITVTKRDDILLNKAYKVSGTAAKLGAKVAYHHCTLLLNADLLNVSRYLNGNTGLVSKATASVKMPVANLANSAPQLTFDYTVGLLTEAYCKKLQNCKVGFTYINPADESMFPGIHSLATQLKKWDWVYGHTPKFHIDRQFCCHIQNTDIQFTICAEVDHGHLLSISIEPRGFRKQDEDCAIAACTNLALALQGIRFWPSDISSVIQHAMAVPNCTALSAQFVSELSKCMSECLVSVASGR
jgi:lipoyltransferase 1